MRHTGFRAYASAPPVPKMPLGLVELLEGLAKDVLKNNPGDAEMYSFCASHMKKLLQIRDGKEPKPKMTLEDKIKKVQEGVRKLAEKRRQEMADFEETASSSENNHENPSSVVDVSVVAEKSQDRESIVGSNHAPEEINEVTDRNQPVLEETLQEVTLNESSGPSKLPSLALDNVDYMEIKDNIDGLISNDQGVTEIPENEYHGDVISIDATSENLAEPQGNEKISLIMVEINNRVTNNIHETENASETQETQKDVISQNVVADISTDNTSILQKSTDVDKCDNEVNEVLDGQNDICNCAEIHVDSEINAINSKQQPSEEHGDDTKSGKEIVDPIHHLIIPSIEKDDSGKQAFTNKDSFSDNLANDSGMHTVKMEDDITASKKPQITNAIILQNNEYVISNSASEEDVAESEPAYEIEKNKESIPSHLTGDINTDNTLEDIDSNSETITELDMRSEDEEKSEKHHGMDLETAAVTIQKLFRTYLFKSRPSTLDDLSNEEDSADLHYQMEEQTPDESGCKREEELNAIKERRAAGLTRMDTVLQTVNEEKSLSVSTDDSSTLSSAATIIQAHVRGFLVRNRRHSNKTISTASLVNSATNSVSLDGENDPNKGKTILNIHIVPEVDNFVTRDASVTTSIDLPFDGSPPTSTGNLHPLSHDVSERRKQLKREDAIQSMSPPSNNSGKLSEDVESLKEVTMTENGKTVVENTVGEEEPKEESLSEATPSHSVTVKTVIEVNLDKIGVDHKTEVETEVKDETNPDEMDVVTPHSEAVRSPTLSDATSKLLHSSEFHDIVLPTNVSRGKSTVVRDFQAVLVYFVVWNQTSS